MKKIIATGKAPKAIGPYSHFGAVTLFMDVSSQVFTTTGGMASSPMRSLRMRKN